ncbi:MAG: hypothetical protein KGO53_11690 [Alphaproteobacteria bacterium]|nr:hypothetical protein [Alphaproteobacteria bacterium]
MKTLGLCLLAIIMAATFALPARAEMCSESFYRDLVARADRLDAQSKTCMRLLRHRGVDTQRMCQTCGPTFSAMVSLQSYIASNRSCLEYDKRSRRAVRSMLQSQQDIAFLRRGCGGW